MANYKEIFTETLNTVVDKVMTSAESGTINNVVEKVRSSAESGTINNVMGKVRDAAESTGIRSFYDKGASRAKIYGQIAKLTVSMNSDNEELKRVFCEIGRLYYEQAKDAPEGYFAPLFAQCEAVSAAIEEKQKEIDELKASVQENTDDIEVEITDDIVDFESIVAADEEENK